MSKNIDLLYVHPYAGHYHYAIIPTGVISIMNNLECKKLGKFYFDVQKKDIKNTKIIAMDLHWYHSLYHVRKLCRKYKSINPNVKIVLGGYTASVFDSILIKDFDCDYIIRGDGEEPMKRLVKRIIKNQSTRNIPNLTHKAFRNTMSFALDNSSFEALNYTTIDWFPQLVKIINRLHNKLPSSNLAVYPFLQGIKGCHKNCRGCYGNRKNQKLLFNRCYLEKTPSKLINELKEYEKSGIRQINILTDLINTSGMKIYPVFDLKYNLNLLYFFHEYNNDLKIFRKLAKSFRHVNIHLPTYTNNKKSKSSVPFIELVKLLNYIHAENMKITFLLDTEHPYKKKELKYLRRKFNISFKYGDSIVVRVPMKSNFKEYKRFYRLSRLNYINPSRKINEWIMRYLTNLPKIYYLLENFYMEARSIKCIIEA
ncbi:MAG: cobalamin-dependent protein [Nanobdellota archaeon]